MNVMLPAAFFTVAVIVIIRLAVSNSEKIHFYAIGLDSGFKIREIREILSFIKLKTLDFKSFLIFFEKN